MVRPIPKIRPLLRWPHSLMQFITVYTPNSVHSNQITPSTTTTVSLAAFRRKLLPLLIPWCLSSGPCANLRTFRSPTRRLSSHRSQTQHPKKTLPASLCTLLLGQACPNKIRLRWLSSRRRGLKRSRNRRSCRNALMIPISITASLVDVSYPKSALISFAVYYRVYLSEGKRDEKAKTSFDESDISLGRINTLFITPPHTSGSLKACIAKLEGLVTPGHALYKDMEVFGDMNSDVAMSDTDVISFQGDTFPGSDEGDPIALVNATANTAAGQKAKLTQGKFLSEYPLDTVALLFSKRRRSSQSWLQSLRSPPHDLGPLPHRTRKSLCRYLFPRRSRHRARLPVIFVKNPLLLQSGLVTSRHGMNSNLYRDHPMFERPTQVISSNVKMFARGTN